MVDLNEDGTLKRKADMFYKRTIKRAVAVTSVETSSEALAVSMNEKARVDLPYMAQITGKTEEKIEEELTGVIFKSPLTDQWENGDEYLSGNVRNFGLQRHLLKVTRNMRAMSGHWNRYSRKNWRLLKLRCG